MTDGRDPLLPGELRDSPDGRRSARDWIVDVALFVLAAGFGLVLLGATWQEHAELAAAFDVAAGIVSLLALWFRRSRPLAVAVLTLSAAVLSALAAGAGMVALFNAALRTSRRTLAALVVLSLAGTVIFPALYPTEDGSYLTDVTVGVLMTAVVVGWGLFARARRELVRSLRERAERLEAEQRLRVAQAREAERRRIAREMHDVLAHRVSLLSLHAGALEFRPDAPPEEIAEAAGVIRATAHAALKDLREVIGVLREGDEGGATEPPQPTLAEIPALVEESRAAGMRLSCRIDVPGEALPEAIGRTAYRIVQEGLTNARKHAPAAAVEVSISAGDTQRTSSAGTGQLVVEVVSRRPVGVAAGTQALAGTGGGTGLIGLAERVGLAGGRLEHGAGAGGDFVLRATLPWTP
jgi:signal transduction histidine kinase